MTTFDLGARTTERAGARAWLALSVLMLPVLLTSIDNTVLTFALPQVSAALRPSGQQLMWLVDIYPLMLAGLLVVMGSLGDRIGRRRLLMIGAAGFGLASILAAYSPNASALLGARALLGVFGATLMPSTLSLIRNIFTERRDRRLAIAVWASMFSGGAALGPIVGGWLLGHLWWGSVFLINVPIIVVFLAAGALLLPESRDPAPGRIDVVSVALVLTTMVPLTFALKQFAAHGPGDLSVAAIVAGVGSLGMFLRRQARSSDPMLDLSLFGDRVFSGAITSNLLSMMGFAGFMFFAAQFLQLVAGLSPMDAALALVPGLAVTVVAGFVAVRLVRLVSARVVVAGSFVLMAAGYAVVALRHEPGAWTIGVAFAVLGLGIGLAETLTNDLMLASVPPRKAGAASAVSETAYEIGAVLGTAVLGSILTLSYRAHLDVPAEAFDRHGAAFQTLGGTLERAALYPNVVGEHLRAAATSAFDAGVQHTAAVAIVIVLAAGVLAWRTLAGASRD